MVMYCDGDDLVCFSLLLEYNASGYICNPGSSNEQDAASGRCFGNISNVSGSEYRV